MMRPSGVCGLCRQWRTLADSHLLPKSLYKLFRADKQRNPNPLHISAAAMLQTATQVKDYFLCDDCEERFNSHGERWTIANCLRGNSFVLQDLLYGAVPYLEVDGSRVYDTAQIVGLDHAAFTYFAVSVFWRAAVRSWPFGVQRFEPIVLGPFAEALRSYLLGITSFPIDTVSLTAFVSMRKPPLSGMHFPVSERQDTFIAHRLLIPGIQFMLVCSKHLRVDQLRGSIAASPHHYVFTSPHTEEVAAAQFAKLMQVHRQRGAQIRQQR